MNQEPSLAGRISPLRNLCTAPPPRPGLRRASQCERRLCNGGREARFGHVIHLGTLSPSGSGVNGKTVDGWRWIMNRAKIPVAIQQLPRQFNPVKFTALTSGWRSPSPPESEYLVLTSKHHDGFALYAPRSGTYRRSELIPPAPGRRWPGLPEGQQSSSLSTYSQMRLARDGHGHPLEWPMRVEDFTRYLAEKVKPKCGELPPLGPIGR